MFGKQQTTYTPQAIRGTLEDPEVQKQQSQQQTQAAPASPIAQFLPQGGAEVGAQPAQPPAQQPPQQSAVPPQGTTGPAIGVAAGPMGKVNVGLAAKWLPKRGV